jgi:predicted ATPase/DNA-binding XRE family transcriptional regulator
LTSGGRLPFGNLLRQFRIDAGLSQEALAERARISLDTIGALERGRRQAPHRETLALISSGLGLAADDHARLEAAAAASRRIGGPRINDIERAAASTSAAAAQPEHNLPYAVNSLHGRDRELGELTALLRARRLVTLHGAGGVGKTRLAIEASRAQLGRDEFRDGAWFVDLGVVAGPDEVAMSIAHVLGIREIPSEPLLETVADALHHERLLLVLDNCEHVLETVARFAQRLAQSCPSVCVLVTSREALEIDGELVFHVEALAPPAERARDAEPARSLDELRESPAVRLFLDRGHDADPHFFLEAAAKDPEAIAEICHRLDGLPLTLELAAARVRDLTLGEICAALDSRFSLLAHGKRTAQRRHRTLRAMLEWSYALLTEDEQQVFRRLGAFAGSWTVDAAAAVCGEPPEVARDIVSTLVSKSLVTVVHGPRHARRYRLLESMRAFARTLAVERGEEAGSARSHAEYYRHRAQAAAEAWRSGPSNEPRAVFGALIEDIGDVRAALDWSVTGRHDVMLGAELTSVLADAWAECGLDAEGLRLVHAAHAALGAEGGVPRLRIQGTADEPDIMAVDPGVGFGALPSWLTAFGAERTYRSGDVVFRAGEEAGELLYVISGTVSLQEIGLEVGAHEILGEIAFFSAQNRRTASAVCSTDVVVRSIGQGPLVDLYDGEPGFRLALIQVFTRRLLQDLERVRDRLGGAEL